MATAGKPRNGALNVKLIKIQLSEVISRLEERQQDLAERFDHANFEMKNLDIQMKHLLGERSFLEIEIKKTIKEAIDTLKKKEDELIRKVKAQTEQDKKQLRTMMKTKQMDLQLYQQQCQAIQQALELEDEAQLFEMYHTSKAVSRTEGVERTDVAKMSFQHDRVQLKQKIEMMDVKISKAGLKTPKTGELDLTAGPVLDEVIDAKLNAKEGCHISDCLVMNVAGRQVTIFSDNCSKNVKSFYKRRGETCYSTIKLSGLPWCMTVINDCKIAVTLPESKQISMVAVTTAGLDLISSIKTSNKYRGLSTLGQSTLVVGSYDPASVDIIDMKGTILKTFSKLPVTGQSFIDPHYIHVNRQGTILVSDYRLKSLICLTQSGDVVFTYTPTGDRALSYPWGITSTSTGDILIADRYKHKVFHLNESGEFIRDILTGQSGFSFPTGLCFDGDKLCVALQSKGLHKYRFG